MSEMPPPPDCGCPQRDGKIYHQRGTCTDPVVAALDWYADGRTEPVAPQPSAPGDHPWRREREAQNAALLAAWRELVARVLMLHIGLIDDELSEETARFLVSENWLLKGKPDLESRHVLLIAKAVGRVMRRAEHANLRAVVVGQLADACACDSDDGDQCYMCNQRADVILGAVAAQPPGDDAIAAWIAAKPREFAAWIRKRDRIEGAGRRPAHEGTPVYLSAIAILSGALRRIDGYAVGAGLEAGALAEIRVIARKALAEADRGRVLPECGGDRIGAIEDDAAADSELLDDAHLLLANGTGVEPLTRHGWEARRDEWCHAYSGRSILRAPARPAPELAAAFSERSRLRAALARIVATTALDADVARSIASAALDGTANDTGLPPGVPGYAAPGAQPELAAAMAESRTLRELLAEIIGLFADPGATFSGKQSRDRVAHATSGQLTRWRAILGPQP